MNHKIKIHIILSFVFFTVQAIAVANTVVDSLQIALIQAIEPGQRAKLCKGIGDQYYATKQDSVLKYYELAKQYAELSPDVNDDITILRSYGYYYTNQINAYQNAIDCYQEAIDLSYQNGSRRNIALIKNDLGIVFWRKGDYPNAVQYHFDANEIADSLNDADLSMRTLLSLGIIHNEGLRNEEAKDYYLRALPLAKEIGHQRAVAVLLNNLGKVYRDLEKFEEAHTYFEHALQKFEDQQNEYWQSLSHYNLGYNFFLQGQHKESIDAYDRALDLSKVTLDKDRTVMILMGLAQTHEATHRCEKAIMYALRAVDILKELDTKLYHQTLNSILSKCYEKQKKYKQSSFYFKKNITLLNESSGSNNHEEELAKMEALYQNQQKSAALDKLQIQYNEEVIKRQKMYFFLIGLLTLLLLSIAIARMVFYRVKIREMEKYDHLRTKLTNDLHDNIGSSLNQIKILANKLAQNQRVANPKKAHHEVSRIKSISNDLISNMYDLIWSIDKDKEQIEDLLNHMRDLASNVFSPLELPFRMKIHAGDKDRKVSIDAELKNNIYAIYKEAINNIVKHTRPEDVQIFVNVINNKLNLSIRNDKGEMLENKFSNKKGLRSMKERTQDIGGILNIDNKENEFIVNFQVELT